MLASRSQAFSSICTVSGSRTISRLCTPRHFCNRLPNLRALPRSALSAQRHGFRIAWSSHQALCPVGHNEGSPPSNALDEITLEQKINILGEWRYASAMGYTIRINNVGEYEFEELDVRNGYHHRGVLRSNGEWLQGDLANQSGQYVGVIRLRLDAKQNTVISQCKSIDGDWGPELVAHSPDEAKILENRRPRDIVRENAMPLFVMAVLLCTSIVAFSEFLRTASWRRTVRPAFSQLGLERYADQLEALWRDNTEGPPP